MAMPPITPPSQIFRRLRAIVDGEPAWAVLPDESDMLLREYEDAAKSLIAKHGSVWSTIQYLNVEIAKACYRESGASQLQ